MFFSQVVVPELTLLRFGVVDDNDKLIAQRVIPLDGLQTGKKRSFIHSQIQTVGMNKCLTVIKDSFTILGISELDRWTVTSIKGQTSNSHSHRQMAVSQRDELVRRSADNSINLFIWKVYARLQVNGAVNPRNGNISPQGRRERGKDDLSHIFLQLPST